MDLIHPLIGQRVRLILDNISIQPKLLLLKTLDLDSIEARARDEGWNPRWGDFPGLALKDRCTAILYRSGKCIVMGIKHPEVCEETTRRLERLLTRP